MNKQNEASGAFFIIPKSLMTDPKYSSLSVKAKVLYGLMLDRMKLSEMNGWKDEDGRTYITFTLNEISKLLDCRKNTALNYVNSLADCGLLLKNKIGLGHPVRYCVKEAEVYSQKINKCIAQEEIGVSKKDNEVYQKGYSNNTEKNNTELSNTLLCVEEEVKENIDYDCLVGIEDKADVDSIVSIIADALTNKNNHIRIGAEVFRKEEVRKRLMSLNDGHISYVLETLHTNKTPIRDIRAYILKLLFYAPTTMNIFYSAKFCSDRNGEVV